MQGTCECPFLMPDLTATISSVGWENYNYPPDYPCWPGGCFEPQIHYQMQSWFDSWAGGITSVASGNRCDA